MIFGMMSHGKICFGCKLPIFDTHLLSIGEHWWHESCVKCEECQTTLREKCYFTDTRLLCKTDYERLYLVRCSGCQQLITPEQYVRKQGNKTFHLSCLKCNLCQREASTGEHIFITSDNIYLCRRDFEQSKQIRKNEKEEKIVEHDSEVDDKSPGSSSVNGEVLNSDEDDDLNKRRGPRTTIKAKQLEVLKSAFIATPKPSRHIREKLAHDTGLSMRVIQVWFQNRRSKERRVKQLSVHDTRRPIRRPKMESTSNGMADMDFRFYQNNNSTTMMQHPAYNKMDSSQYPDYLSSSQQNNQIHYQSLVHDDLMLGNEFMNDPNNNELSLMESLSQTDIARNNINQSLMATYEAL